MRDDDNNMSNDHQVKATTNGMAKQKPEILDKGYSTSTAKSTAQESSEHDKNAWSQNQQKLFEKALASVPKDASDRWTQIARNVPGKTKVIKTLYIWLNMKYKVFFSLNTTMYVPCSVITPMFNCNLV